MSEGFILAEDRALKGFLQDITVVDAKNASRPVKTWFGYPDVEIREQTFPFLTIDLIDIIPADDRQTSGFLYDEDYQGTVTSTGGEVYGYRIPVAYDLIYQVTTYSRNPRHDRAIINQLFNKFPSKYSHLEVPVPLGTYGTSRAMFLDGFVKRDTVDTETGNRRLLRNVFTLRVISQMTPATAETAIKQVQTVKINTTTSYIPSDYTPVQ